MTGVAGTSFVLFGIAGLGMTEMALLMEGMSNNGIPLLMLVVGPTMCMSLIARHGSDAQTLVGS